MLKSQTNFPHNPYYLHNECEEIYRTELNGPECLMKKAVDKWCIGGANLLDYDYSQEMVRWSVHV